MRSSTCVAMHSWERTFSLQVCYEVLHVLFPNIIQNPESTHAHPCTLEVVHKSFLCLFFPFNVLSLFCLSDPRSPRITKSFSFFSISRMLKMFCSASLTSNMLMQFDWQPHIRLVDTVLAATFAPNSLASSPRHGQRGIKHGAAENMRGPATPRLV